MKNLMNGQVVAPTAAPTPETEAAKVAGLRTLILDLLFVSPVITAKEWATAVERTSNTESPATLAKWYQNTVAEIGRREAAAAPTAPAPVVYATGQQKQEIVKLLNHPAISRPRKTKELVGLNRLTDAQAVALLADLTAIAFPAPTRPAGAGLVVNGRGQLALPTLTRYAVKVAAGEEGVSYVQAA